jgi:lactate racemase
MQTEFPWGNSVLKVNVPKHWKILGQLKPKSIQPKGSIVDLVGQGLANPIASSRLSEKDLRNKEITLVVDDHSRPTPVSEFICPVVDQLFEAGADNHKITILIATGVHRSSTQSELEKKLGNEICSRFKVIIHDSSDLESLADLGITKRGTPVQLNKQLTKSDFIVCLGAIEPHLLLGFGGGLKMLLPGCASAKTVGKNHLQGIEEDLFDFVGTLGNASGMRLDLEEGAAMLNKDIFIVNCALNENAKPVRFFCGDPIAAHREGEKFVASLSGMEIPEQSDIVLTNSFPMEADLRQSTKCMGNAMYAVKQSGVILGCLKCENGLGEMPKSGKTLPYPLLRQIVKIIGQNRILPLAQKVRKNSPVEEVFISHFGLQMLRRNQLGIFSDSPLLPEDLGKRLGFVRSFTDLDRLFQWANSKSPKNPTAWIFPIGGTSYATNSAMRS